MGGGACGHSVDPVLDRKAVGVLEGARGLFEVAGKHPQGAELQVVLGGKG